MVWDISLNIAFSDFNGLNILDYIKIKKVGKKLERSKYPYEHQPGQCCFSY